MITGTHILLKSEKAEADRAFFRDILGFHSVDAGGGWLIFARLRQKLESIPPTAKVGRKLMAAVRC
jgi:hypothetical protein